MRLLELFEPVSEITDITVSKSAGYRSVRPSKHWTDFRLLDQRFMDFLVVMEADADWRHIMLLDPSKLKPAGPGKTKHKVKGLDQDIPDAAIVGGIQMEPATGSPFGKAWKVSFVAFNPRYQGRGIAPLFYQWMLDNPITGIKVIKAGQSQTPGSKLLWSQLSKVLHVVAYEPETKRTSEVHIGPNGLLAADFPIYYDKRVEDRIREEHRDRIADLRAKITQDDQALKKAIMRVEKQRDQALKEYDRTVDVGLYAMANA